MEGLNVIVDCHFQLETSGMYSCCEVLDSCGSMSTSVVNSKEIAYCVLRLGLSFLNIDSVLLHDSLSPPLLVSGTVDT